MVDPSLKGRNLFIRKGWDAIEIYHYERDLSLNKYIIYFSGITLRRDVFLD